MKKRTTLTAREVQTVRRALSTAIEYEKEFLSCLHPKDKFVRQTQKTIAGFEKLRRKLNPPLLQTLPPVG